MGRVVVVGSINVDLVTTVERHPRPGETVLGTSLRRLAGGKGANQAVAAAAAGASVAMIGCVGDDGSGVAYRERLHALGIDVTGVEVVPATPSGHALIAVDEAGENTIIVVPGANHAMREETLAPLRSVGEGDVVVVQLEIPLDLVAAAAETAHARGARVVINVAPYAALPRHVLALADPIVANEHEALQLADSDAVGSSLLVTLGAAGATWDGETVPGVRVPTSEVIDTTGAGDAFVGALAAALAAGAGRHPALAAATEAGAAAVRHAGAQPAAQF